MKADMPPVLIAGTGALGCLFAARLSAAQVPVLMTGTWEAGLQALEQDGVFLVQPDGTQQAYPVQVVRNEYSGIPLLSALVLVKSWQTRRAAEQISRWLSDNGVALSLQNGLGNREILAQVLGPVRAAVGATTTGATLLGPGRVRPAGEGVVSLDASPKLVPLVDLLRQAGFLVLQVSDANALLWGKLVINAAINPLTALLGVPNGELLVRPEARLLMAELAQEAAAVASGLGIRLPYDDPAAAAESVAARTAANHSSMLQDIRRGAPTEIDAICGEIVRLGEPLGAPVSLNRMMWRLVRAMADKQYESKGEGFSNQL